MKEIIVSFEIAKLSKEKGFVEPTHSYYFEDGEFREHILTGTNGYYGEEYEHSLEEFYENWNDKFLTKKTGDRCFGCSKSNGYLETYSAPTQSLLQKWLREKHSIHVEVVVWYRVDYVVNIVHADGSTHGLYKDSYREVWNVYEEALERGLKEALELI